MKRGWLCIPVLLLVLQALAPPAPARADDSGDEILARAFARSDGAEERFRPHRCREDGQTSVHNGDDELEFDGTHWREYVQWTPDSTEVLGEGEELIFSKEEEEKDSEEDEKQEEGKDKSESLELDFLSSEMRGKYRFRFAAIEERDGRQLARFALRPEKKKKKLWQGMIWLDPDSGALAALDLEPVKRRLGLKSMRIEMDLVDFEGMTLPARMDLHIQAKLPLLFHKKIQTKVDFSNYALVTAE